MNRNGNALRRRFVLAVVGVALGVLVLTYVVTYGLVRRSLENNALSSLRDRSSGLAEFMQDPALSGRPLAKLKAALKVSDIGIVGVRPDGTVVSIPAVSNTGLPDTLSSSDILPDSLRQGLEVSGRQGKTVFLAIPAQTLPNGTRAVVVATDTVDTSVLRQLFPLLLLAGLIALGLAFAVATWLAGRFTRPISEIERAAQQLASGDLSARAELPEKVDEQLAALGTTLNSMARQLEDARGSERAFLLSISHDLRTPLTSIRGYAEALADGTLDDAAPDDRKRAATVIGSEARRLERLVRDLLDLSRLDSHQFSLNARPCDANEIVRTAAEAFAPKAQELGITLSVLPAPALPVDLDPERLAQIVANLVENALKYASANVTVSAVATEPAAFGLVVTDDGPGIPAAEAARVFDRLYTVRATPGRSVGTGLGLAIVRELSAAMGGRAWAETPEAGGSRFVVTLPTNVARASV